MEKGWIALDIDGTITLDKYTVPLEVVSYLKKQVELGWRLLMTTGRPFKFASMALSQFDFPYFFSLQNGSIAMEMPEKRVLLKNYLSSKKVALIEAAFEGISGDLIVYAGYEHGDFGYWRPEKFSEEGKRYVNELQKRQKEKWKEVKSFEALQDEFPLVKCFGKEKEMLLIQSRLEKTGDFEISLLRDPFEEGYFILLITAFSSSKGKVLKELIHLFGRGKKVIAAGDDENDVSLLKEADVKIAMHHAPKKLQAVASFIAPPTKELGILHALEMATRG